MEPAPPSPSAAAEAHSAPMAEMPAAAVPDLAPPPRRRREKRGKARHHKSRSARKLVREQRTSRGLKIVLAVLLLALTLVVVMGGKNQTHLVEQNDRLKRTVEQLQERAQKAEQLSRELSTKVDSLVHARLPGLLEVQYDTVIPLNKRYIKNVIFSLSRDSGRTAHEYRFAVFNRDVTPVIPKFSLYLFDANGIQLGGANVTKTSTTSEGLHRSLAPGEIRSYSGTTKLIANTEPSYYLISFK